MSEPVAAITLYLDHGVFAPTGHVNTSNADQPFGSLWLVGNMSLATANAADLDRLVEVATELAANLRAAQGDTAGGAS